MKIFIKYIIIRDYKSVFLCILDSSFAYMQGTKFVICLLMHLTLPFAETTLNLLKYNLSRLALHYAFGSVDEEILPNQENRDFFLEKCYSYLIFYL